MSDFLKKLKGLFVEEAVSSTTPPPSVPPAPKPERQQTPRSEPKKEATINTPPPPPPPPFVSPRNNSGSVNEKFTEMLLGAMNTANMEGFDYIEYKQAIQNLVNLPMDEATRFKSAFAMAQTLGASKEKILQSGQYYLDILKQEQQKFSAAAARQREQQVGSKEVEHKEMGNTIQQKAEQIKLLTAEIEQLRQKQEALNNEITEAASKVDATSADFEVSYQHIVGKIQHDLQQINQLI